MSFLLVFRLAAAPAYRRLPTVFWSESYNWVLEDFEDPHENQLCTLRSDWRTNTNLLLLRFTRVSELASHTIYNRSTKIHRGRVDVSRRTRVAYFRQRD